MENIKNIIESLLLVAEEPLKIDRIKDILALAGKKEIQNALTELSSEYENRKGGFFLREVAGGYQIRTRPEYKEWIKRLIQPKPLRLSKPALETLSIIAYKQPIIRSDIEHIRGVNCGGILRMLLERKFLEVFDLKNLEDLPTPKEISELSDTASENME
jgi:segregation and condensation protein B